MGLNERLERLERRCPPPPAVVKVIMADTPEELAEAEAGGPVVKILRAVTVDAL